MCLALGAAIPLRRTYTLKKLNYFAYFHSIVWYGVICDKVFTVPTNIITLMKSH
jgi:hypothetical protein